MKFISLLILLITIGCGENREPGSVIFQESVDPVQEVPEKEIDVVIEAKLAKLYNVSDKNSGELLITTGKNRYGYVGVAKEGEFDLSKFTRLTLERHEEFMCLCGPEASMIMVLRSSASIICGYLIFSKKHNSMTVVDRHGIVSSHYRFQALKKEKETSLFGGSINTVDLDSRAKDIIQ